MTDIQNLLRRRDVLKAAGAAGLLSATGFASGGAAAQERAEMRTYSYSLQEGDVFRVRLRPHDPWGNPATEPVPADCLDAEADEEFQMFIVEAYRDEEFIGYRSLLAPVERLAPEVIEPEGTATTPAETETEFETETELETETTEAALQDETTEEETPTDDEDEETTVATDEETTTVGEEDLPEVRLGQWYRVASSEECDGMYRLLIETTEEPETDEGPETTEGEDETTEVEDETTEVEDGTVETETEDEDTD